MHIYIKENDKSEKSEKQIIAMVFLKFNGFKLVKRDLLGESGLSVCFENK